MDASLQRLRKLGYTRLLWPALLFTLSIFSITGCGNENNPAPTVVTTTRTEEVIVQSTVTSVPDSSIPIPSRVPTSVRAWTATEQAYIDKVAGWQKRYEGDFVKLSDLLANPNPLDNGWTSDLNNLLTDFDALNNEVLTYVAPIRFIESQGRLVEAARQSQTGSNLVSQGIQEFDLGKIEQGAREIENSAALVPQVVDDLQQLVP
ncbi:MAG: hypothetical protein ABI670_08890 [Chloroflexota bacterium]